MSPNAMASERALAFVDLYGRRFGVQNRAQLRPRPRRAQLGLQQSQRDGIGIEHVRFEQMHQGVPVTGGEFVVHLRGAEVVAANGKILEDLPELVVPTIVAAEAARLATLVVARYAPEQTGVAEYLEPRLEVFVPDVFGDAVRPPRLSWFVEATAPGIRQFIWIDAENGEVLLTFNQVAEARNRQVYNAFSNSNLPGTLARSEGQGVGGVTNVDSAYDFTGHTYDYFMNTHGRDSFDNAGATLVATIDYCGDPCPYPNAFWNGSQTVFGDGLVADDVVSHEWTHAITEYSAGLFYYSQSGALNESFSDVFGETIDLLNGVGTDTSAVRWQMGEDVSHPSFGGALRNMMTPTALGDPGKVSDPQYLCHPSFDSQGVHVNSGVPNHAYALVVDGGTYNGRTIKGIGLSKAARIWYRALTVYLTSGSNFSDAYDAFTQSAADLIGTSGITSADRDEVVKALLAVEITRLPGCIGAATAPAMCTAGAPVSLFREGMEPDSSLPWGVTDSGNGSWFVTTGYAKDGVRSFYGENRGSVSDHRVTMTNPVALPSGARAYFDHSYRFETSLPSAYWDGGVVEYSVDSGSTWVDAGALMDAGRKYAGSIVANEGNPLGGRQAFVGSSFGYTGTRLNLSALAGRSVLLRFRIGTDPIVSDLGWFIDNISIYSCPTYAATPATLTYGAGGGARTLAVTATPADAPWTATSDQGWLTVTPASGAGSRTVTATAAPHTTSVVPRTATLTLQRGDQSVWKTIAVTQSAPTPTLQVAPLAWTVEAPGGTRAIAVTAVPADATTAWTATTAAAWLTVSAPGGAGTGAVTLTAAANASARERVGTATVAGKVVTVRQRGDGPALTLTPSTWNVGAAGGKQPVTLTAAPTDLAWTAVSSAPWLQVNGVGSPGTELEFAL